MPKSGEALTRLRHVFSLADELFCFVFPSFRTQHRWKVEKQHTNTHPLSLLKTNKQTRKQTLLLSKNRKLSVFFFSSCVLQ